MPSSVPAVETIKLARVQTGLSETVSFLKTFGYLYDAFEIGEKGNTEGRERGCRQSLYRGKKKLLTTQVENLHAVSHFKYFHAFVSTINYVSPIGANNDKRR